MEMEMEGVDKVGGRGRRVAGRGCCPEARLVTGSRGILTVTTTAAYENDYLLIYGQQRRLGLGVRWRVRFGMGASISHASMSSAATMLATLASFMLERRYLAVL